MRVLITGAAGLIGRAAATHAQALGWEVRLIDLVPQAQAGFDPAVYAVCDMLDFAALREQMAGCDAVVHMAALRSPLHAPGQEVYRINMVGVFNVYEAAATLGIRRVVQASSINAIGCAWNIGDFRPQYLPVDEAHPTETTDPYSFGKQQGEDIGAYYWRREGISGVAFRFPGVYEMEAQADNRKGEEYRQGMRQFLDEFAALPEDERARQLAEVHQHCMAFRGARRMEYPNRYGRGPEPEGINPYLWWAYTFDRYNLWASLDVRDAAQAIVKSITAEYEGSHPLFINDDINTLDYDSDTLARLFFPYLPAERRRLTGSQALFSIARARDLIGFAPEYSPYKTRQGSHSC